MDTKQDNAKRNAGFAAVDHVDDGMTIGIGTGSTAKFFIDAIGERISAGWRIKGVPTSAQSESLARAVGVEIIAPDETTVIDVAIDGADEIDPALNLIKGGGGALLREKIVAQAAKKFIVIADGSKSVKTLGAFPLPVEIEPFGWALTVGRVRETLREMNLDVAKLQLRAGADGPFLSDGGHLILDCSLNRIEAPSILEERLTNIPGVIESGLFCGITDLAIIGENETCRVIEPSR